MLSITVCTLVRQDPYEYTDDRWIDLGIGWMPGSIQEQKVVRNGLTYWVQNVSVHKFSTLEEANLFLDARGYGRFYL